MASDELKKLADELKEARKNTNISLKEIASKTRIDIKFLEALEEGDFEVMPEVYIRAFIKEYAIQTKLDPDEILRKYELAKANKPIDDVEEFIEEPSQEQPVEETKEQPVKREFADEITQDETETQSSFAENRTLILSGIIIFILALAAVYFLFIKQSASDIIVERPFEEILKDQQTDQNQRFEIEEEPASTSNTVAPSDSLVLSINAVDTCWFSVTVDGNQEREFMLFKNTSTTVKAAKRFDLVVGNLGGVNLKLNGKVLPTNGTKGQRKTLSINANGLISNSNQ